MSEEGGRAVRHHYDRRQPGFFRTELLTEQSTNYAEPAGRSCRTCKDRRRDPPRRNREAARLGVEVDSCGDLYPDDQGNDPVDGCAEWRPPPGSGHELTAVLPC